MSSGKKLVVVAPHGFCSGVARAVTAAESVVAQAGGERVYCLNEIVHNAHVVERLKRDGMVFVRSVEEVPEGAVVLFSAHGVSPAVREAAAARRLRMVDATCPFVTKVHVEVKRFVARGAQVVCIGHRNHEEVVGVVGEAPESVVVVESVAEAEALEVDEGRPVAVVTQTTLGAVQADSVMGVLRRRFPGLWLPASTDICYATRNRQEAVRVLAGVCERVVVLGSANSSNSQRLVETAHGAGVESFLVSEVGELERWEWDSVRVVGVTSGASTPESFLDRVAEELRERFGFTGYEELVAVEERTPVFAEIALPE